jgi:hypothetical protein
MSIGYSLMQADIAGNTAANNGDSYWGGFGKSALISGSSMLVGYFTGGLVGSLMPKPNIFLATPASSIFFGALGGSASGGLAGGISSIISGGAFKDGFKNGAILGGIMGGINGLSTYNRGNKFVVAMLAEHDLPVTGNVTPSQENADTYWDIFNGETPQMNKLYAEGNGIYEDYATYIDGAYTIGGTKGAGITVPISKTKLSNVYLSDIAFQSEWYLYLTMDHELVHVLDFANGLWDPSDITGVSLDLSELRAYHSTCYQTYRNFPEGHYFYNKEVQKAMYPNAYNEYLRLIKKYNNY